MKKTNCWHPFYLKLKESGFNMKSFKGLDDDGKYDYLINDYIPNQGRADMGAFLDYGLSIHNYTCWKYSQFFNDTFSQEVTKKLKDVFGK